MSAKVVLMVKRSAWQLYLEERGDERLRGLVDAGDPAVEPLRLSHEEHERTVAEVVAALEAAHAEVTAMRRAGEAFDATGCDLVISVGGDGTLLSASHWVTDVPILGINSAPSHSVGFFCGAKSGESASAIARALAGDLPKTVLTRMRVRVNDRLVAARVLNDALFCHASPAATSRYLATLGGVTEQQKSSGFWIGPAAGSTAAQRSAGGTVLPLSSKQLQLVVREPYTPLGESYRLRHAFIAPGAELVVRSKMHDAKIFFDGPVYSVDLGYGDALTFSSDTEPVTVLGLPPRRGWGGGA